MMHERNVLYYVTSMRDNAYKNGDLPQPGGRVEIGQVRPSFGQLTFNRNRSSRVSAHPGVVVVPGRSSIQIVPKVSIIRLAVNNVCAVSCIPCNAPCMSIITNSSLPVDEWLRSVQCNLVRDQIRAMARMGQRPRGSCSRRLLVAGDRQTLPTRRREAQPHWH